MSTERGSWVTKAPQPHALGHAGLVGPGGRLDPIGGFGPARDAVAPVPDGGPVPGGSPRLGMHEACVLGKTTSPAPA